MTHSSRTKKIALVVSVFMLPLLLALHAPTPSVLAADGRLYFSPASATLQPGGQVSLAILADGTDFNAAQLDLTYDPSLQYVSCSLSGSVLPNMPINRVSSNSVSLSLYNIGDISGTGLLLATCKFKALQGSGAPEVRLAETSSIQSAGKPIAGGGAKAVITLTTTSTTPPTPPDPPAGTTDNTTQNNNTATSQPKAGGTNNTTTSPRPATPTVTPPSSDTQPPVIQKVEPLGFLGEELQVRITTDEPTSALIRFGQSKENLEQSATADDYNSTYFVPLGAISKAITTWDNFYYSVEVIDQAGNKTVSNVNQISLKPVKLTLKLKDKAGNVLGNATVIINGRTYSTNEDGEVVLENMLPGLVIVSTKDTATNTEQYIGELTTAQNQADQVYEISPTGFKKVDSQQTIIFVSVAASVIAVALVGGMLIARKVAGHPRYYATAPAHSAIVGGNGIGENTYASPSATTQHYTPQTIIEPTAQQPASTPSVQTPSSSNPDNPVYKS